MGAPDLLVDGRTLDDRHPGVRRYWVPVLRAWAGQGGSGFVGYGPGEPPEPMLREAGFLPLELPRAARHPLALRAARPLVRASGVGATLSPLYLTLDGAPRSLACVFDLTGRSHARSLVARGAWELAMRRVARRASRVIVPSRATATALAESRQAGRPAVIRFDADWCPICDRLERSTLGDREVEAVAAFELVLIDVTETTPARRKLMKQFGVSGVPALLFVSRRGLILEQPRISGYVEPDRLLAALDAVSSRQEPNQVASRR